MKLALLIIPLIGIVSCKQTNKETASPEENASLHLDISTTSLIVLGTVQDAGSPHIACIKACCASLFESPAKNRKVVSLGLIDPENKKTYLFEATPDLPEQMKILAQNADFNEKETPDGIFLTHAHIGHYSGLMYLGKEAMNANQVPVFAMPRMKSFLEENGPWSQLVTNSNISLQDMENQKSVELTSNLSVTPFAVPHRDEYSETVGYKIVGPNKSVLFIPDIDKWEKWETSIVQAISTVDYAFIDATFYDGEEINNRDISQIPHPFIIESMAALKELPKNEKAKIYFIHFNHTNPALDIKSEQSAVIIRNGFNIAQIYDVLTL